MQKLNSLSHKNNRYKYYCEIISQIACKSICDFIVIDQKRFISSINVTIY